MSNRSRRFKFTNPDSMPSELVVDIRDGERLRASGDGKTHLVVHRGPLSRDSDPSWDRTRRYVRDHGYVLAYETVSPPTQQVPREIRTLLYCRPQDRLEFNANPDRADRAIRALLDGAMNRGNAAVSRDQSALPNGSPDNRERK